ncbi:MAG: DUF4406 domain-containing protein [Actinomycetes bacterium]
MRVYVSGPMRGRPCFNIPSFDRAATVIRGAGWEAVNPVDIGGGVTGWTHPMSLSGFRQTMDRNCQEICECDAIAVLPGWRTSEGSTAEVALACVCRLRILDALTLNDITADVMEWWTSLTGFTSPGTFQ